MKLTEWFPPDVLPIYQGVYQVEWLIGEPVTFYNYFDGRFFNWGESTPQRATRSVSPPDQREIIRWRGLAK